MTLPHLGFLDAFISDPPPRWPGWVRVLRSPQDDLPGALTALLVHAHARIDLAMFALDDAVLVSALVDAARRVPVVNVTLDSYQATTPYEAALLARTVWPGTVDLAVGRSEHGAIMHRKDLVIDGGIVASGSTNWTHSGTRLQDNTLVVLRDRTVAGRMQTQMDELHAWVKAHPAAGAGAMFDAEPG